MLMVLVRHGEKVMAPFDPDVPLSPRGQSQAERLAEEVLANRLPHPTQIWSSPRKRAQSTLAPLAQAYGLTLEVKPGLDERLERESVDAFHVRIEELIASLNSQVTYCCSHYDWLFDAVMGLPSDMLEPAMEAHFSFAQARVFELQDGLWHLRSPWKGSQ